MNIKVVDKKTGCVDEMWTRRYKNALANDEYVDIPYGLKLAIRGKEAIKKSKYSYNRK